MATRKWSKPEGITVAHIVLHSTLGPCACMHACLSTTGSQAYKLCLDVTSSSILTLSPSLPILFINLLSKQLSLPLQWRTLWIAPSKKAPTLGPRRKSKADLLTEKGIPGGDIKVETNQGVVSLSSDVRVTESQKDTAVKIAQQIKGVKSVTAAGLKVE